MGIVSKEGTLHFFFLYLFIYLHYLVLASTLNNRPRGNRNIVMLSSTEHEVCLLINVEMPTINGISTFISRRNSVLGLSDRLKMLNFLIFILRANKNYGKGRN